MNEKHERYLAAKREGKSVKDCVKAAIPGVSEHHVRFKWWLENGEKIPAIARQIEFEGLNKPKKAAKKPAAKKDDDVADDIG